MNHPCPICSTALAVYYSLKTEDCRCQCPNAQCVLNQRNVVGIGDRTQEAVDNFHLKARRFDGNLALRK